MTIVFALWTSASMASPNFSTREFLREGFPVSTEEIPPLCASIPMSERGFSEIIPNEVRTVAGDTRRSPMERVTDSYAALNRIESARGRYRVENLPWGGVRVAPTHMKNSMCEWVPMASMLERPLSLSSGSGRYSAFEVMEAINLELKRNPLPHAEYSRLIHPPGGPSSTPVVLGEDPTILDALLALGSAWHDIHGIFLQWKLVYAPVRMGEEAIGDPARWRLVLTAWTPPSRRLLGESTDEMDFESVRSTESP